MQLSFGKLCATGGWLIDYGGCYVIFGRSVPEREGVQWGIESQALIGSWIN